MTSTAQEAVALARRGIPVFPCRGKPPLNRHGRNGATCDLRTIDQWWWRHPDANIGVPTGAESGWLLLDPDLYKPGAPEAWGELTDRLGPLPATLEAATPRGGRHLVFAYPGDELRPYRATIGDGIDVKACGGYLIVAPSRTEHGAYRWVNDLAPAELPRPWLEAVRQPVRDQAPAPRRQAPTGRVGAGDGRPGDDFNARADWAADVLVPAGWTYLFTASDGNHHWARPGKASTSATVSPDLQWFYPYTTSTLLEAQRPFDKFGADVALFHGVDFRAGTRALAERGFGARSRQAA